LLQDKSKLKLATSPPDALPRSGLLPWVFVLQFNGSDTATKELLCAGPPV